MLYAIGVILGVLVIALVALGISTLLNWWVDR